MMGIGVAFWILMLLWLVFGVVGPYQFGEGNRYWYGHGLFAFILFLLIGWGIFGSPIKYRKE